MLSSDITTTDDEAAQVSNLNAIAMIEYEHCRLEKEVEKEIQAAPNLLFSVSVPACGTERIMYQGTLVHEVHSPWQELQRASATFDADNRRKL